jgi:uncharacterized protein
MTDDDVPAFWRRLRLPGLADVHTHFLPERMQRRVWAHFDEAGPTFFPEPGAVDVVTAALDAGARVFKLHLQVGGFDPRTPELDAVWALLADTGTPVVVHAGSGPVATGFTGPGPIGEVLARHTRLALIVAHMGAPEYEDFLDLATTHERARLDTTMAFTDFFQQMRPFPAGRREQLRELGLAGKVLLGSDFPSIPYAYAHQLEALDRLDLGDDWLRAVCWGSAARLFALEA